MSRRETKTKGGFPEPREVMYGKGHRPPYKTCLTPAVDLQTAIDRSTTIRTSLHDVERTLVLAVLLVIVVVFAFLRNLRATLIPVVAVPDRNIRRDVLVRLQPRQSRSWR